MVYCGLLAQGDTYECGIPLRPYAQSQELWTGLGRVRLVSLVDMVDAGGVYTPSAPAREGVLGFDLLRRIHPSEPLTP